MILHSLNAWGGGFQTYKSSKTGKQKWKSVTVFTLINVKQPRGSFCSFCFVSMGGLRLQNNERAPRQGGEELI